MQVAHVIAGFVPPSACRSSRLTLLQALELPLASAISDGPWGGHKLLFWYRAVLQGYTLFHGTTLMLRAIEESNISLPDVYFKVSPSHQYMPSPPMICGQIP